MYILLDHHKHIAHPSISGIAYVYRLILDIISINTFRRSQNKGLSAPTPHKGGNTTEYPPLKKGWHHGGLQVWCHPCGHSLGGAAPKDHSLGSGAALHNVRPHWGHRRFPGHGRCHTILPVGIFNVIKYY